MLLQEKARYHADEYRHLFLKMLTTKEKDADLRQHDKKRALQDAISHLRI